jgi:hypothetical protein
VLYSYIIVRKTIVEPYTDVLVFFTTDDVQHVGRNPFGLWPIKVFKSSSCFFTLVYKQHGTKNVLLYLVTIGADDVSEL